MHPTTTSHSWDAFMSGSPLQKVRARWLVGVCDCREKNVILGQKEPAGIITEECNATWTKAGRNQQCWVVVRWAGQ